jgi:hypothetical protein
MPNSHVNLFLRFHFFKIKKTKIFVHYLLHNLNNNFFVITTHYLQN